MIEKIVNLYAAGTKPTRILAILRGEDPNCQLIAKDITNITQKSGRDKRGGLSSIAFLLSELEGDDFYWEKDFDPVTGQITKLFYAHKSCIQELKNNPDLILFDSTYKSNRYKMPLLNIGAVGANNQNISVSVCFLRNEDTEAYSWAMRSLRKMIEKYDIELPLTLITDRELALMNPLEEIFPESRHLLCSWHGKTRRFYPKPPKLDDLHPDHVVFLEAWKFLIASPSEEAYKARLHAFLHGGFPQGAVDYVVKTWLIWKEKLVSCWVDDIAHFRNKNTSRLEGMHKVLKDYISTPIGTLLTVF